MIVSCLPFIAIGERKQPTYGKNVQLLSSGKVEWIEQLKKAKAKELELKKMRDMQKAMNDEPEKEFDEQTGQEKGRKKELRESGKEEEANESAIVEEEFIDYTMANETSNTGESAGPAVVHLNDSLPRSTGLTAPSLSTLLLCIFSLVYVDPYTRSIHFFRPSTVTYKHPSIFVN
ncbi:unnamed protein product [Gongylonema pulchrum]|uniref:Cir_N domain-containing protein n=1 Tax=Gongylonema pulchrum TaxID=637853 RepID=A0A183EME2_9BILA|nr:unnamed protein product [Gongylonema pulchrum]